MMLTVKLQTDNEQVDQIFAIRINGIKYDLEYLLIEIC